MFSVGGTARVADLMGLRVASLGRLIVSNVRRSMDLVRRLGALGRRMGGGGRLKPAIEEGGGEGLDESVKSELDMVLDEDEDDETLDGITGSGERGGGRGKGGLTDNVDSGSISGKGLERYVFWVSS